ncbi:MAG TPA: hypothetical protein VGD43_16705 [Micromonospora sp.]
MTISDRSETLMARFLMATVLHDRDARVGDSPGLDDLRAFVRKTVRYLRNPRLDPGELETVLRSVLGGNIPIEGIPAGRAEVLKMLVFGGVVRDLTLSATDVGRLLVRAESWAAERGFQPTLAAP